VAAADGRGGADGRVALRMSRGDCSGALGSRGDTPAIWPNVTTLRNRSRHGLPGQLGRVG